MGSLFYVCVVAIISLFIGAKLASAHTLSHEGHVTGGGQAAGGGQRT